MYTASILILCFAFTFIHQGKEVLIDSTVTSFLHILIGAASTTDLENNSNVTLLSNCTKNITINLHAEKGSQGETGPPGPQGELNCLINNS